MENGNTIYIEVIVPAKLDTTFTYYVSGESAGKIRRGSVVRVEVGAKEHIGIVDSVSDTTGLSPEITIKEAEPILHILPVRDSEISFWKEIAEYYLCSVGEVFKAAYPDIRKMCDMKRLSILSAEAGISDAAEMPGAEIHAAEMPGAKMHEAGMKFLLPELTAAQKDALGKVKEAFSSDRTALLHGVTGSGKTEIYITLAAEELAAGRNVLYMLPEIAISRQLSDRLEAIFGDRLMIFHSKRTFAERRKVQQTLRSGKSSPHIILGLRSAVFLPFSDLGLIIVDEEHDSSYKQEEPAPRYNGRDAAVMLGKMHGSKVLLGSATPSFESFYNAEAGRYAYVPLQERYGNGNEPETIVIDTRKERMRKNMRKSFSARLLGMIEERAAAGEQTVIFRSRRAYSPFVQCTSCGFIPKCPHCNVPLTYHKFSESLECHYCGYRKHYDSICPECGTHTLADVGAGTEKLEEELSELLPELRIARYDSDITKSRKDDIRTLEDFAKHRTDVLIGTQMISKGFDFSNVTLAAIISADSVIAQGDFRAEEKAMQLLSQLKGRTGRRDKRGTLVIQTAQPDNRIFTSLSMNRDPDSGTAFNESRNTMIRLLRERYEYSYPPFTRAIRITVKSRNGQRACRFASRVAETAKSLGIERVNGPFQPLLDSVAGLKTYEVWIWLPRDRKLKERKKAIREMLEDLYRTEKFWEQVITDVDPS